MRRLSASTKCSKMPGDDSRVSQYSRTVQNTIMNDDDGGRREPIGGCFGRRPAPSSSCDNRPLTRDGLLSHSSGVLYKSILMNLEHLEIRTDAC